MTLRDELERAARPLRSAVGWRTLLPLLLAGVLLLTATAWISATGFFGIAAALVLVGWLAVTAGTVLGVLRSLRVRARLDAGAAAQLLEVRAPTRKGALTTLLANPVSGTSAELNRVAQELQSAWVAEHGALVLEPTVDEQVRSNRRLMVLLAVAVGGLLLARPLGGAPAMVLRPWQAWQALVQPVRLSVDQERVAAGQSVQFEIVALGQTSARLQLRRPGESWRDQVVELDASGRAVMNTGPLDADLVARATAGGRTSPEVHVAIRLPVFLGSFTLHAEYPGYLGLEAELLPTDADTIVIPEGTRLQLKGRATTPLSLARWVSPRDTVALTVDGESFDGVTTPRGEAAWTLAVRPAEGAEVEGIPAPMVVRVVPDMSPRVDLPVPGADTVAPPSGRLSLVVAMEDDHGIVAARIVARPSGGRPAANIPLALDGGSPDRLLIATALQLDSLGLAPGDTLWYSAIAVDNSPGGKSGRSREYLVRVPTAAEQREARLEATSETASALDSLAAAARQAQRAAEDLSRERTRESVGARGGSDVMSAEAARRVEQAAEAQREVEQQAEALQRDLDELRRAAEREGVADSSLAAQLAEIRDLLERAMSPELRESMQRLQESIRDLDPDAARQALADLARQQSQMRQAMERARELFRRAEQETRLAALAQEADELADLQRRAMELLAEDLATGARAEDQLAQRADSLAAALDRSAEATAAEAPRDGLREVAEQVRDAAGEMRSASESARQGQQQRAEQQARSAQQKMDPVSRRIQDERKELQEAMKEEVIAALDRLLMETSLILARQNAVAESLRRGAMVAQVRSEQSMLEEAVGKLFEQVIEVSGKNALISPRIAVALALARDGMRVTIDAIAAASPSLGRAVEQSGEAVDALALAAYSLLRSRSSVEQASSGSGLEEAMQQMQQMAGQQGQASDQGQSMLSAGGQDLQAMMQLAMRQRAIAQQLERMQAQGSMPGAGELAQEALDLSRQIEQGRLNPETVERQQRLFRRMLDAGRSLEGDQRDEQKERQSTAATGDERSLPGALDRSVLEGARYPIPGWDELQRLGPDDRRRVLDYFRRLTETPP